MALAVLFKILSAYCVRETSKLNNNKKSTEREFPSLRVMILCHQSFYHVARIQIDYFEKLAGCYGNHNKNYHKTFIALKKRGNEPFSIRCENRNTLNVIFMSEFQC